MRQLALRRVLPACVLLTGGMLLASCGSTTSTSTSTTGTSSTSDPLYFTTTSLPVAYLAETYDAPVGVAGGAGPGSVYPNRPAGTAPGRGYKGMSGRRPVGRRRSQEEVVYCG